MCVEERCNPSINIPVFNLCCSNGQIEIPDLEKPPDPLTNLFIHPGKRGKKFRQNIRVYNSALAFTSIGAKLDNNKSDNQSNVFTYRISGQMYHRTGPLIPNDSTPRFSQLYIYDTAYELQNRIKHVQNVDEDVL
jgi:hypothetical protein